jgi:hypothetical protein
VSTNELLLIPSDVRVRTSYEITTYFGFIADGNADYNNNKEKTLYLMERIQEGETLNNG